MAQRWIKNWFSNYEPFETPVVYQGITFKYPENMYQAFKAEKQHVDIRRELASLSPGGSKRWWRNKSRKDRYQRSDWFQINISAMDYILRIKFVKGTRWYKKLKETTGEIVETNNWHDNFWGDCICPKCENKTGRNELGKLLMKIRDE